MRRIKLVEEEGPVSFGRTVAFAIGLICAVFFVNYLNGKNGLSSANDMSFAIKNLSQIGIIFFYGFLFTSIFSFGYDFWARKFKKQNK